ncbi:MAG TPA: hypothetical protein VMG37_10545 [Solirubrobacteraceae bacterium]|nr:hypothetical protein [Solirubrobacteraceae bacterium]HUA04899.1 hypothetical protein [Solirubrobacteraceae bacterium]
MSPSRRVVNPIKASVLAVAAVVVVLSGCGSSKPAYCTARSNLSSSIKGLTSPEGGLSGLQAQLKKIETDATSVVNSAKGDFPNETAAIKSSVDGLSSAVKSLPSNPSATQIAAIAPAAASVVNSVKSFTNATSSKCS